MEKYKSYTTKDFLNDSQFVEWQLFYSEELNTHWETILNTYPHLLDSIEEAKSTFRGYLVLNDFHLSEDERSRMSKQFENKIKERKSKRISLYIKTAVAVACAILFVFITFNKNIKEDPLNVELTQKEEIEELKSSNEIQLITSDSTIILENNAELAYNTDKTSIEDKSEVEGKMNTLIVPYGRRSTLILSDGTKIWVNSGTTVIYPSVFTSSKARSINVDGEIYIEVEKDVQRPFFVNSSAFAVEVLGTKFNISAYNEDAESYVVLVEGAVRINKSNKKIDIKPDQMYYQAHDTNYQVKTVDVNNYISWKNGWLQFDSLTLKELSARISKYYGKRIICDDDVKNLRSSGKLLLVDDIDKLLNTITENMNISYTLNQDTIYFSAK